MYSSRTVNYIKELRVKNFTLTEIVKKTNLSKSRIFDYIRDIPQSKCLIKKIKLNKIEGQKIGALGRRGKSIKQYIFNKPKIWDSGFVNFTAHFLFDGCVQRTWCGYNNRNQTLIQIIVRGMNKYLNVSDYKIYKNRRTGVVRIAYHNVEIASFIKIKTKELLEYILFAPQNQKISFLQAFFDDEGSINFKNNVRVVRGYQHSRKILEIVQKLLSDLEIEAKIDNRDIEISIGRKENLLKFQKLINFTPGLKVNGNRSNSIWKKDLEKRKILQMAINSYL